MEIPLLSAVACETMIHTRALVHNLEIEHKL